MDDPPEGFPSRTELLPLLGPVKKQGDGWLLAYCPSHADGHKHGHRGGQSLGLSPRGVLRCFAGCDVKDVLAALYEGKDRRKPRSEAPRGPSGGGWHQIDAYDYRTPDGKLVAIKRRLERPGVDGERNEKRFTWSLPDGTSGLGGLSLVDMPLWGCDDLPPGRVWFVEGESACRAVREHKELCVTGGWGASQRDFGDALEILRGREVILWPDNDESGRGYMRAIRAALRNIAARTVLISPHGPPKGDAVDWFRAGHDIDQLFDDVLDGPTVDVLEGGYRVRIPTERGVAAFTFMDPRRGRGQLTADLSVTLALVDGDERDPYEETLNVQSHSGREGLVRELTRMHGKELNWTELVNTAYVRFRRTVEQMLGSQAEETAGQDSQTGPEHILTPYVLENAGTALFSAPGNGKSTTALLWAVSIDSGVETIWPIPRPRRALYVNLERSRQHFARRLARVNRVLGLDPERSLLFLHARGRSMTDVLDEVRATVRNRDVGVVFLDSLSRAGGGTLNADDIVNRNMDMLNSLGCAWVAIAHTPRSDDTHILGSIAHDAAIDVGVRLVADHSRQNVLGVGLQIVKANDIPTEARPTTWAYEMDPDLGIVAVRKARADEFIEVEEKAPLPLEDQIAAYLAEHGASTATVIATAIGKNGSLVARYLKRDRFVRLERKGKDQPFGLRSDSDPNVVPVQHQSNVGVVTDDVPTDTSREVQRTTFSSEAVDLGPCARCKRPGASHLSRVDGESPVCLACFDEEDEHAAAV